MNIFEGWNISLATNYSIFGTNLGHDRDAGIFIHIFIAVRWAVVRIVWEQLQIVVYECFWLVYHGINISVDPPSVL